MSGAVAGNPNHLFSHTQQGPAITRTLREFGINEEIGDLHLVTVHAMTDLAGVSGCGQCDHFKAALA